MRPNSDVPNLEVVLPEPVRDRGHADVAMWRMAHQEFLRSEGVRSFLGQIPTIDDDTPVVAQRFHLVPGAGAEAPRSCC